MSVLVYIDHADGEIKKSSLEAASYGAQVATQLGVAAEGLILGNPGADLAALGKQGLTKIHQVKDDSLNQFDAGRYGGRCCQLPWGYRGGII